MSIFLFCSFENLSPLNFVFVVLHSKKSHEKKVQFTKIEFEKSVLFQVKWLKSHDLNLQLLNLEFVMLLSRKDTNSKFELLKSDLFIDKCFIFVFSKLECEKLQLLIYFALEKFDSEKSQ